MVKMPYYRMTSTDGEHTRKAPLCELFSSDKEQKLCMMVKCWSNPSGTYSTSVFFETGIDFQLLKFIEEFGMTSIEFDGYEFIIDFCSCDSDIDFCSCEFDTSFKTFREALSFAMMEDERFFKDCTNPFMNENH